MADETLNPASLPPSLSQTETSAQGAERPTVAFCQQCGRGLTVNTVRKVGSGIFCEPCAAQGSSSTTPDDPRATAPGYGPVHSPVMDAPVAPPPIPGQPNPVLAGFLGFIPGVGAMYNGQYAKGVIHLVIFVVLTSFADNLNWVLWWFVWGWIFYQVFDAYHTAQARREGMPLPDPFGWNDLGDRMGWGRTSPPASAPTMNHVRPTPEASHPTQAYPQGQVPASTSEVPTANSAQTARVDPSFAPVAWPSSRPEAGYSSPPGSATPPPSLPYAAPYGPTYTGMPTPPPDPSVPAQPSLSQRFPAGAAWLIGLGILFLIANLAPGWRLEARWLVPVLLALAAFWIGGRRLETAIRHRRGGVPTDFPGLAESLAGAAVLLTLAILLALQNAFIVPLRRSWPAVLIVWGVLLLLGRAHPAIAPPSDFAEKPEPPAPGNAPLR